jgi:hypothetical protein
MTQFLEFIQNSFFQAHKYWYCDCTIAVCLPSNQVVSYMKGYLMYDSPDDSDIPLYCEGKLESYRSDYVLNFRTSIEEDEDLYSFVGNYYPLSFRLERKGKQQLFATFKWNDYQGNRSNNIQLLGYQSGVLYGFGKLQAIDTNQSDGEMMYLINIGKPQPLSRDIFQEQKHPQFGKNNPEKMEFEFWKYMVKTRDSAYAATAKFGNSENQLDSPVWCFHRFGVSRIELSDGRLICIGGEHEDFYDPDFYIYNDVIVVHPDGEITIYAYPREVFPPTDFHSATLIDKFQGFIYIIGCLGYLQDRKHGETPVYFLNCETFDIEEVETTGEKPGWIYKHKAELLASENCIKIAQGTIIELEEDQQVYRDNTEIYYLNLSSWQWYRGEIGD